MRTTLRGRRALPVALALLAAPGWPGGAAQATARPAPPPTATALLDRPARLDVRDVPLADALRALAERSGVPLAYSPSRLAALPPASCACADVALGDALTRLLTGSGLTYRETAGQILVLPRAADAAPGDVDAAPEPPGALGLVGTAHASQARSADSAIVTGRVTTDGGAPIVSALVNIVGLRLSATTNDAGVYRIPVPAARFAAGTDTLRVVRLGYRPVNVPFTLSAGTVVVNAVMSSQAVALDQVVVTGTAGNQERRAQAAVVATIDASDVARQAPVTNITQLLESRVPGVTITEGTGNTGTATRILIRGAASISLSNQPLVFIDGVRADAGARALVNVSGTGAATSGQAPSVLNDLNPNDIESIEIVKGPAAATLYGADASAGVIQIITKKGRVGSRSFSQDLSLEYDALDPNFEVPTNYATCTAALVAANSPNPLCRGLTAGAIIADNPAERINAFRDGWMGALDYSMRGGGESYGFFASAGINDEQGTTINNTLKQRTGRGSFTFTPTAKLTFDATFGLTRIDYDLPRNDQDAYGYYVQSAFGNPRTVTEGSDGRLAGGMLFPNQSLESMSAIISRTSALRALPTVQARYSPLSWLTNRVTLGADLTQAEGFQLFPKNNFGWYPSVTPFGSEVSTIRTDERIYTVDYLGNIRTEFGGGRFSSDLSFGSQYINRVSERLQGSGQGLISNEATLVTNANTSTVGQGFGEQRSVGMFVQEQIGINDRLFLQVGLRADRNSAFGSEVGTFYLPKFGASYVISEESFWRGLASTIPTLRLRAAYGTTGRSPSSGAIQTYGTAKFVNEAGAAELGVTPGDPGNPDLRPERGKEFEAGFDAGFLDDRVGLELTYFHKLSDDLIVAVPTAPSSGFGGSIANIGEVENSGLELTVRATPLAQRNVAWDAALNGSTLHNEILELGTAGTFINNFRAFVEGRQMGVYWAHKVRSVDEAAGRAITSDTAEFIGNQLPTFQASLTNTLTLFRNVRLYALLEAKTGYYVYNVNQENRDRGRQNSAEVVFPADQGGYSAAKRLERMGPYRGETSGATIGVSNVKSPYMQKGDHVRLREVSATFLLPTSLAQRARLTGASLTIGGRNLGLWTSEYEGDDPDVLGLGAAASGVNQLFNADVFTTPPNRRWIVRLNLQF